MSLSVISCAVDANQTVPAELDHYQLKYRYYYEARTVTDFILARSLLY